MNQNLSTVTVAPEHGARLVLEQGGPGHLATRNLEQHIEDTNYKGLSSGFGSPTSNSTFNIQVSSSCINVFIKL